MILVQDLVKRYGSFTAVDGVSLDVAPGEIHGFLGPNGAGTTTTIRGSSPACSSPAPAAC
jgi:ABC-2 type transport system ATP-binding protein